MKPIAEVPPPTTTTCLSRKSSSVDVVGRVHVTAGEVGHAGVVRHERRAPRAGRVDEELRRDLVTRRGRRGGSSNVLRRRPKKPLAPSPPRSAAARGPRSRTQQVDALVHDRAHVHRAAHAQVEVLLEPAVVVGDDLLGRKGAVGGVEAQPELGHARQVVDAVRGAEAQRRPAVLPRAARAGGAVEHDEILVGDELEAAQVVGDGEAGLPGADHHDLHAFRARHHLSISARVAG